MGMRFIITERSRNAKTGPIMVVTSDAETCPTACPFRAGACYGKHGPLGGLWRALSQAPADATSIPNGRSRVAVKGLVDLFAAIRRQRGQLWRLNQAGDLPGVGDAIDRFALDAITDTNKHAEAKGFTYSHKPVIAGEHAASNREAIAAANRRGFTVNLSADNLADADAKADLGIAPVAVVLPTAQLENTTTPQGRKVVICPAIKRDDITCKRCGLCQRSDRKVIVGFPAHGPAKAKAARIAS